MISEDEGQDYFTGDNVQLAIGQGLLSASPLQFAVGYSTLANGGFVMKPEIVMAIYQPGVPDAHESGYADLSQARLAEDPNTDGEVVRQIPMPTPIHDEIINGLRRVIYRAGHHQRQLPPHDRRELFYELPDGAHADRRQDRHGAGRRQLPVERLVGVRRVQHRRRRGRTRSYAYLEKAGFGAKAAAPGGQVHVHCTCPGRRAMDPVLPSDPLELDTSSDLRGPAAAAGRHACMPAAGSTPRD